MSIGFRFLQLAVITPMAALVTSCASTLPTPPGTTPSPAASFGPTVEAKSTARGAQAARLCFAPRYPVEALQADVEGTTRLQLEVSEEGRVLQTTVLRSAGLTGLHKKLDQAAIDSFADCPFRPALDAQGRQVRGAAVVEFQWRIEDAKR
ncbi:energy transducer TonB [Aquincola tertiaricarbonis]|uniref:Energy transducer TonB n=1 Tax=Aquincola tertiaricarbonis TaxID=391953 RepID=A0ABY4S640_AQUTE|nr:energy transducer TonB [Aquincola tertiaricarbonis]URI07884.1 energy transducer TonB [Aquincola tertiaricarbonis]